jgi:hypothetical protein
VFPFGANRCAILTVTCQIESAMPFTLQIDGFAQT